MLRTWPDPTLDEGPGDDRVSARLAVGALLLVGVLAALGAEASFLASTQVTKKWQAITEIEFRDPNLLGESVATIFKSPSIWVPVAEREGLDQAEFQKNYASSVQDGTQIVRITFDDADPELAERVVTGVTDAYLSRFETPKDNAQTVTINNYIEELRRVEATLVASLQGPTELSFEQNATQQQQLVAVRQQLANAQLTVDTRATATGATEVDPRVVTSAFIDDEPISPRPLKLTLFGGIAGGIAGVAACFVVLHRTAQRQSTPTPRTPSAPVSSPRRRTPGRWAKRGLDIVVSTALLAILSPLLVLISALIVITTSRPVLFRQERVGQHGTTFRIIKFRTMAVDNDDSEHRAFQTRLIAGHDVAANDGIYKLSDRRVTPIGQLLRRLSLDELPQLWNVLRGEMSLVGPRPTLQWEADLFSPRQRLRLLVPPGCSGLWQVSGRNKLTTPEMLELDAQYVQRWTFGRDLSILARTPFAILRGDGAR